MKTHIKKHKILLVSATLIYFYRKELAKCRLLLLKEERDQMEKFRNLIKL